VDADQARLSQAIGQLLDNAVRYSNEESEITIEVVSRADDVQIRVTDQGRGISSDVLPHIFEAFALRQPSRSGLGLGLGIARALCELHGGKISVRSGGEGRGSEFTITLPLALQASDQAPASSAAPQRSVDTAHPAASRRILIADDNQAVRNSFASIL